MALGSAPQDEGPRTLLRVYLQKRADLVRFFALRLGDQSEAEDLVQEIYLKISNSQPKEEIRSPAAYLYRIGTNVLVDRRRGRLRATRREADWHVANTSVVGGEFVANEPAGEEALEAKQRLAKLMEAVGNLPPQCQRVFRLHKFEGLSHAEVAKALGISRSAVEKHVSAALKSLARWLA